MLSKSTEVFAKSIGFKLSETCAYGIYNDYFISLYENRAKKILKISCCLGNRDEYSEDYLNVNEAVQSVLEKYHISDYEVCENGIKLVMSAPLTLIREALEYIIGVLAESGIPDSNYCSDCGIEFPQSEKRRLVTLTKGSSEDKRLVCEHCALALAERNDTVGESTAESVKPKYVAGTVSAVITGIIMMAIFSLACYVFSINGRTGMKAYIVCAIGFLLGGCVYLMYNAVAKKIDNKGMIIVCAVSTLATIGSTFFGIIAGTGKYFEKTYDIAFSSVFSKFTDYAGFTFTDGKSLNLFIFASIISLCIALAAIILLYGMANKKSGASNQIKVSIQTIK